MEQALKRKDFTPFYAAVLCMFGIVLNIGGTHVATNFHLPLFLDSFGTMLSAALGGILPGMMVGYISNLVRGLDDPISLYYGVCNVLIAVFTTIFYLKKWFKKPGTAVCAIGIYSLIGGALGSVITYFLYGLNFGSGISAPLAKTIYSYGMPSKFWSQFLADVGIDVLDKTVCVVLLIIVIKVLPSKAKYPFRQYAHKHESLFANIMTQENLPDRKASKTLSLRTKIVLLVGLSTILIGTTASVISYVLFRSSVIEYKTQLGHIVMSEVNTEVMTFLIKVITLFFGIFLVILAGTLWYAEKGLITPINEMAIATNAFAYHNEEDRNDYIERIRSLGINTGDEIENLYHAIAKTTEDTMNYIDDVNEKTETITKMQHGLILVLADMVESRDKCTGDHVRKTAAYTRIICEELKAENAFPDIITDAFIDNVSNAAPLHDVGKINISDTILNKPGKLTNSEFDLMKTHTTYGAYIISRAITTVSDSDYLEESQRLAKYHHERWDGKGYPEGLKGEEIPLSARIMAVADVFDALVSRRSYKDPYSFNQAMDIIEDETGTHFDPMVVAAFIHAKERIKAVSETLMEESNQA